MIPPSIAEVLKQKSYTVLSHRTAFTAQEEAAATHVPGRQWAKTVVCVADGHPVLAVLPAHYRVDLERLARLAGASAATLAAEDELRGMYPDCEPGAMPPFGRLFGQRVFVDRTIAADPEIVFHAGTHTDAVRMRYADLEELMQATVGEFAMPPTPHAHGAHHHQA